MVGLLPPSLGRAAPYLIAAALTVLLALLAFLQHRWLVQVSEAERQRAHVHVESVATAFARDFNETLSRLAFDFLPLFVEPVAPGANPEQQERVADARLAELLESRLQRWRGTATEPDLLAEVLVAEKLGGPESARLRRLEEPARRLAEVPWPAALAPLRERLEQSADLQPTWSWRQRRGSLGIEALDERLPSLILPLFDRPPDVLETRPLGEAAPRRSLLRGSGRWVVLRLDRQVLEEQILPDLAQRHFRDAGLGLRIVAKSGGELIFAAGRPMPAEATIETAVDLFGPLTFSRAFRPPMAEFEVPAAPPVPPVPPEPPPPIGYPVPAVAPLPPELPETPPGASSPRVAAPGASSPRVAAPGPGSLGITMPGIAAPAPVPPPAPAPAPPPPPAAAEPRARAGGSMMWLAREESGAPVELGEGRWRLEVFHEAGSLDLAIDRAQQRNLAIAFGILLVLGLAMLFLARAARNAQELARRQMELVAGVTHELLTPLAAMKSAGQNLRDGVVQEAPKVARYGELIVKESDRLSDLVGQVLLWAGLASHQSVPQHETILPRQLAEEALEDLRPALETAHFEVALDLPPDLPAVSGDPAGLRQALANLIANAVKYGRRADARPYLQLAARTLADGRLAIAVTDRGPGIAPEDLPHLFEPFYRGRKVVASNVAGAGLGLALVRRIVESHGGELRVQSVAGSGATFTMILPGAKGDGR